MTDKNFGFLGREFQQALIKSIIEDKKYGERIIEVLDSKYFDNNSFKFIMENIKELYSKYGRIPDYETVTLKIINENGESQSTKIHIDTLDIVKNTKNETPYLKDTALNFCKQQNLKRTLKTVNEIIENGQFEDYLKIEDLVKKALQVGLQSEDPIDIFDRIELALEKDHRMAIPTGIVGIDNLLKGGLGRGELGVILAPTGTGKTTILTKFANSAFNVGYNVLHIFFEDNTNNIKRKHFTIWSGIAPDDQIDRKDEVIEVVNKAFTNSKGKLLLLKLPSDSVTVSELKSRIRKIESDGTKIDLLVVDYVDCISKETHTEREWEGEGPIMRKLESMSSEFDMAVWTATQGDRSSISSEVVTSDQMGGSIKKAQIAHVIISIAKTLEQKEHKLATMTLLKSRIGDDGIVFANCKFNNEYMEIDTETQNTLLGMEQQKEENNKNRARKAFELRQEAAAKGGAIIRTIE